MEGSSKRTPDIVILLERCLPFFYLNMYKKGCFLGLTLPILKAHRLVLDLAILLGDFPSEVNDIPPPLPYPGAPLSIQVRSCEGV